MVPAGRDEAEESEDDDDEDDCIGPRPPAPGDSSSSLQSQVQGKKISKIFRFGFLSGP